jgi:hypothetical protein
MDDLSGDNPNVANSQSRYLIGYEQELAENLTGGVQYYLEHLSSYDAYRRTLPAGMPAADENRQVLTLRLTQLLMRQNLRLGLFVYYSPTDRDAYVRPSVNYKIDDHWETGVGGNVFFGAHDYTFFGQFERDSNVYVSLRYGF